MNIEFHVDIHGAVWSGMAQDEVQRYRQRVLEVVSGVGETAIKHYLPTQYMYLGHHGGTPQFNPVPSNAGALEAAIHTEQAIQDVVLIVDTPVQYGAWIEGIDPLNMVIWPHRRNPPARRFPGYHTFRKIAQVLQAGQAGVIARKELPPYITAMNL